MKKLSVFLMAVIAISFMSSCSNDQPIKKVSLNNQVDSLSYAMGVSQTMQGLDNYLMQNGIDSTHIADFIKGIEEGVKFNPEDKKENARTIGHQLGQLMTQQWIPGMNQQLFGADSTTKINKDNFIAGFIDAAKNKELKMSKEDAQMYSTTKSKEIHEKALEKTYAEKKAADLKFLEENKQREGVQVTESGLQYKVIKEGKGPKPSPTDVVKVHYIGTKIDGSEFDSSIKRNKPFEFNVGGGVIPGWIEGVQLMNVGSKYIFYVPFNLAYGPEGKPGSIDPFSTLIFEVELLEILPVK